MKKIVWIFGGLIITLGLVFPFCFVSCMNPNLATLISGIWSALATVTLGLIALWQNKRYKEYTDRYNDLQYMPEFYKADLNELLSASGKLKSPFEVKVATGEAYAALRITVMAYNPPILNLNIYKLIVDERLIGDQPIGKAVEIHPSFPAVPMNLYVPKSTVEDKKEHRAVAVFRYENLYGTVYSKTVEFQYCGLQISDARFEKAQRVFD